MASSPCKYGDPFCPCQDGFLCHYEGPNPMTPPTQEPTMHRIHSPQPESDATIEAAIRAKGLTAPRITPADIEANIASERYFTATEGVYGAANMANPDAGSVRCWSAHQSLDLLTFCVLVLRNGFIVTGESACVSPENFDAGIGRRIARANAVQKIWPLMGYQLRSVLATDEAKAMRQDYTVGQMVETLAGQVVLGHIDSLDTEVRAGGSRARVRVDVLPGSEV